MNLEKIQLAVSKYSFSAESQGDAVIVKNKKGETVARVTASGVEQLYYGNKNLCGSLVRNDIVSALKIENESRTNAKAALVTAQHEMKVAEATCQPAVIETARRNYVAASQAWEGVRA